MSRTAKIGLIVGGVVLALVLLVPTLIGAFTGWGSGGWGGWGIMGPGMMGGFGMMGFGMVVFWGLIIWGIVTLVNRGGANASYATHSHTNDNSAMEILKQRYARGEITKAEYEEHKKDLM
jgi:putative membrane protein